MQLSKKARIEIAKLVINTYGYPSLVKMTGISRQSIWAWTNNGIPYSWFIFFQDKVKGIKTIVAREKDGDL